MKKTLNYVLLLMLAMMAINLQSCKDDDDDDNKTKDTSSSDIIGTWKETGIIAMCEFFPLDSTSIVYLKYDGKNKYTAIYSGEKWNIYQDTYSVKNSIFKESSDNEKYVVFFSEDEIEIKYVKDIGSICYKKATLPAEVDSLIAHNQYPSYATADNSIE